VASANNPLAPITAINFQNYYLPTLYLLPEQHANEMQLRGVFATTRMIVRATLPVSNAPTGFATSVSGLGDLNVFDAFLLTKEGAKNQFGIGPLLLPPLQPTMRWEMASGKGARPWSSSLNPFRPC
jgi:hypothetical protein